MNGADVKTLEQLAERMRLDAMRGVGLSASAVSSIAGIIQAAIGAPLMWPSRESGAEAAEAYYPGSPDLRHGFNAGVKWAVENYIPTVEPSRRFGE
jgi:hypothetical protein